MANESERYKEICITAQSYNFSIELVATYDNNTTEGQMTFSGVYSENACTVMDAIVTDVYVGGADVPVCVDVDLRDDETVSEERIISLSLQADNNSISTGPLSILTAIDDDGKP